MLNVKLLLALAICTSCACLSTASYPGYVHNQILDIIFPNEVQVADFSYFPTPEGYRYSYTLRDGTRREKIANIVDRNSPEAAPFLKSEVKRRNRPRPRAGTKNRKLSPKALQSLAG